MFHKAIVKDDSRSHGNKSKIVDLFQLINKTIKREKSRTLGKHTKIANVLSDLNKTIYDYKRGYNQSQVNKPKNYLKDFLIRLAEHFIGKSKYGNVFNIFDFSRSNF